MSGQRSRSTRKSSRSLVRTTVGAAALSMALAAGTAHATPWHFTLTPYAWATDLGIDTKIDGRQVIDKTIPVGDLISEIDTTFQMRFEAKRGAYGAMVDTFDVTMSDQKQGVVLPEGAGTADVDSDMGLTIMDVAALFDPKGDHQGFAFLGGTRIIDNRAAVDATFLTPFGPVTQSYDTSDTLVDALVGVRFSRQFSRHCTDHTWSAGPAVTYAFGETGRFGLTAGYRRMEVDFQDEDGLDNKMTLSGFLLGLRAAF
jgi:hypothetical protein